MSAGATVSGPSILHAGCRSCARSRSHGRWRARLVVAPAPRQNRFISGDDLGLDNREIATIVRRALMDLVMAFQTIKRQIQAAPDPRATSNRS